MSRFRVWMNGKGLQDIDKSIYILDVQEDQPQVTIDTASNAKSDGMHILNQARESLPVTITFEVHEYSLERRARVIEAIQAWAQDGVLRVNYRPGQRLECVCTSLPSVGSTLQWTAPVTVTFTAFVIPYWEAENVQRAGINTPTTSASCGIRPVGTAKQTPLWFTVRNAGSGTVNSINIVCATTNTQFQLRTLNLAPGADVKAGYDSLGYLYIKKSDGTSVLDKRTAASSDDILLNLQTGNTLNVQADNPATFEFSARGRWL